MARDPRLTTTSYAVLGVLSLRPGTAYEIVKEVGRSLSHFWPRSERRLYDEPKRLVESGYARTREEGMGGRLRTVYSITGEGRAALREWMDEPVAPPSFESEAVLRVSLADLGTKTQLLAALAQAREQSAALQKVGREIAQDALDGNDPFPERLHVVALMFEFVRGHIDLIERWARWAEEQIGNWPDDISAASDRANLESFKRAAEGHHGPSWNP